MTLNFCYSGAYHKCVGVTSVCHYTQLLWCQGWNQELPATSQPSHISSYKTKFFSWYLKCAESTVLIANSMHRSGFWAARICTWMMLWDVSEVVSREFSVLHSVCCHFGGFNFRKWEGKLCQLWPMRFQVFGVILAQCVQLCPLYRPQYSLSRQERLSLAGPIPALLPKMPLVHQQDQRLHRGFQDW